jgi:phage-related protein
MEFSLEFYETLDRKQPVREFLDGLDRGTGQKVLAYLKLLRERGFLPFPYSRNVEGVKKLRELRIEFASNIYRIFYCMASERRIILLHGFQKKSRKTPSREIMVARNRMMDYLRKRRREE